MDVAVLSAWLDEIEKHGITLVLFLMILFFWFIPWVRAMQKRDAIKMVEKEDHLEMQMVYEEEVNKILALCADNLRCQWAVLWQFHNGASTIGGVPFMKMSVTNEFVAVDYAPRTDLYQQIPVSVFLEAIIAIRDNEYLSVGVNEKVYPPISNSYRRDGVARGYMMRVDDVGGRMIGILSCSYAEDNMGLMSNQIEAMDGYASRLSMALAQIAAVTPPQHRRKDDGA